MSNAIANHPPPLSPFRFDTSPQGEADVDPDQIAVREERNTGHNGWGADGFRFKDVLDIVNPLQHIPVVSSIYRMVTGDEIAPAPRALGGALFGGPIGLVAAVANQIMEDETGADFGDTALAMFNGTNDVSDPGKAGQDIGSPAPQLAVAASESPTATPSALMEQLRGKTALGVPNTFIPSDAAARAGLFSGKGLPVPASAPDLNSRQAEAHGSGAALQSAPAGSLDRLIAQSQNAANNAASTGPAGPGPQIPTDSGNVHEWMLRALGKYETMPKG